MQGYQTFLSFLLSHWCQNTEENLCWTEMSDFFLHKLQHYVVNFLYDEVLGIAGQYATSHCKPLLVMFM